MYQHLPAATVSEKMANAAFVLIEKLALFKKAVIRNEVVV
jgi:hypothetical protein